MYMTLIIFALIRGIFAKIPCCKYNDGYEKARKIRDEYLLTMENNNG